MLTINYVDSAVDYNGKISFIINANFKGVDYTDLQHSIPSKWPDVDAVCEAWLENNTPSEPPFDAETAREARKYRFENTIDTMNPLWYDSLTATQKTNLATWRQQWLDYPSTGVVPDETLVSDIF